jgi:hypothetical protein
MLFFEDKEHALDYSHVRVVTTLIHGVPHQLPNGAQARSYTFSLASNQALPVDLNPTLIMHYDRSALRAEGHLLIYRQDHGDGEAPAANSATWSSLPTYLQPGSSFAAAALNEDSAGQLVDFRPTGPRVERYRLYWTPHPLRFSPVRRTDA